MSIAPRFPPIPLFDVVEDREWVNRAICRRKGSLFFEPFGERPGPRSRRELQAKQLCTRCPVHDECLEAGRRNRECGIWGGETEEERALAGYPPRGNVRRGVIAARDAGRNPHHPPGSGGPDGEAA